MTASERFGVEPDAGRAVKWPAAGLSGLVIGIKLGHEVGALPLNSVPGLLAHFFEYVIKRRPGDNLATGAATLA
jgi:hypothetical protein